MPRSEARPSPNRDPQTIRHPIELIRNKSRIAETLGRLAADVLDWTLTVSREKRTEEDPETKTVRQAMLLVQVIDAVLKSLEILPVRIAGFRNDKRGTIVQLAPRTSGRDILAADIGERSTSDVMDRLFDRDDLGIDVEWRLSTSGGLSSRNADNTPIQFIDVDRGSEGQAVFEFEVLGLLPSESRTAVSPQEG